MKTLYQTLKQRKRPEDVAEIILDVLQGQLTKDELAILKKASSKSLRKQFLGYTSMAQEFFRVVGAKPQVERTLELFKLPTTTEVNTDDVQAIEVFIRDVSPLIHKTFGASSYQADRLNRAQRKAAGLDVSKRQYNKLFRQLRHLEKKLTRMIREYRKSEFQKIAKHGLIHQLSYEEFSKDVLSACFIAYYTTRCNLRSEFTIEGQQRPYDEIADMLFKKCTGHRTQWEQFWHRDIGIEVQPNYLAIACIYPNERVLEHLSDQQKGELLGRWTTVLQDIAGLLAELWSQNDINRQTMVVKRGNDSSTWNHTAGAWNKARDAWMNLIYSLGLEEILDSMCFGKVLRLMAADVVYWHHRSGNGLDANTDVWNVLPLPWEVFQEKAVCTRQKVVHACKKAGLNAEKSGWIAPRPHGIARYRPTPELVHGVSISNAFLATILKKQGYFSGKTLKPYPIATN